MQSQCQVFDKCMNKDWTSEVINRKAIEIVFFSFFTLNGSKNPLENFWQIIFNNVYKSNIYLFHYLSHSSTIHWGNISTLACTLFNRIHFSVFFSFSLIFHYSTIVIIDLINLLNMQIDFPAAKFVPETKKNSKKNLCTQLRIFKSIIGWRQSIQLFFIIHFTWSIKKLTDSIVFICGSIQCALCIVDESKNSCMYGYRR